MSIAMDQKLLNLEAQVKLMAIELPVLREEVQKLAELLHEKANQAQKTLHVNRK